MPFLDLPPRLLSLFLTPFGLLLGSFCNVLIHRLPQEAPEDRDVVKKASHCPSCKAKIKPWHNVPIFGWLGLRGKCAACGWPIPFRYPLVELLGGVILGGAHWLFPFGTLIWLKAVLCAFALVVLFFTDLTEMILPDAVQFPLMALGVLAALPQLAWPEAVMKVWGRDGGLLQALAFHNGLQPAPAFPGFEAAVTWRQSLLGLALGYGAPALLNLAYKALRKTDGLGMGDFKMLAWLGAFWGWAPMLGILFVGAALGTAVGVPLMLLRRSGGQTMLPFGCFLALATPLVVFFGRALWLGYIAWIG